MKMIRFTMEHVDVIDVENDYKEIEKALGINDYWDTPFVSICGKRYIVICGDTGKMRGDEISCICASAFVTNRLCEPFMVGNLLITKFDGKEDYETLNEDDVETIMSRVIDFGEHHAKSKYRYVLIID